MRSFAGLLAFVLCACAKTAHEGMSMSSSAAEPMAYSPEVQAGYSRVRDATASYRVLDSAVVKGYPATVAQCLADSTHGAMGYHHVNRGYVDSRIELDKPEILLYERKA